VDEQGRFLGLTSLIVISPGGKMAEKLRPAQAVTPGAAAAVLGYGHVPENLQADLLPIASAEREAQEVSASFVNSRLLRGTGIEMSELAEALQQSEVFHFAGHAIRDGGVMKLVAGDRGGSAMLLAPNTLPDAAFGKLSLVVLSSCSSGRADHESRVDPEGLASTFLRRGVPQVVATRWDIDSEATAVFMGSMYRALLQGETVSLALQRAARDFQGSPRWSHPYYWAPFSTFGRS
jgi:CHAT domain-containing protein